jgi:hypothetical protein
MRNGGLSRLQGVMQGAVDVAAQVIKHARGHHSVECASDRQNSVVKLKHDRVRASVVKLKHDRVRASH